MEADLDIIQIIGGAIILSALAFPLAALPTFIIWYFTNKIISGVSTISAWRMTIKCFLLSLCTTFLVLFTYMSDNYEGGEVFIFLAIILSILWSLVIIVSRLIYNYSMRRNEKTHNTRSADG